MLAFASLGAGVSAEQNNEQVSDLEDLGILELSISEEGVIEATVTKESLYAFMDVEECQVPAIESLSMILTLSDVGELELTNFTMDLGEEQSDEVEITIHLSEDILELLESEEIDLEELVEEIGIEDYDEEYVEYMGSDIYWADQAYQVRGSQEDYEAVLDSDDAEDEFYRVLEEFEENYDTFANDTLGARLHWADEAYQIRGSQEDYDRVMDAEDPADEFYTIYEEVMQDCEDEDEFGPEINDETDDQNWNESDDQVWNESDDQVWNESDDQVWNESDDQVWNESDDDETWEDYPEVDELYREHCDRGWLRGVFTLDDDGNGTMRGLVMNEDGDVVGNMWGQFNTDGFAHGLGGADNLTDVKWKAVYEDGRFTGLWKMIDENDSMNGLLKGHYEINETGDGGVFHGKWKELDCRDFRDEMDRLHPSDVEPRHDPIRMDVERADDVRQVDNSPKEKPLMDKLSDVMDKPIVADENGGAIVDIGDAAAGSTLGTIALLGAGFIRRRVTGGV